MPRLTIGMPVYNGAEFIGAALDSILDQTYRDYEVIISDNASADRTEEICRDYAARDGRIQYYRNPENIGASDNYNAVYYRASGEYFKWASCNDICHPELLEKCVRVLDANPDVVLCYPETRVFTETIADAESYEDNLYLMQESPCDRYRMFLGKVRLNNVMNGVLRTGSLHDTAMIRTYFSSDTALMAELLLRGKFCQVKDTFFYRRMDEKTATSLKSDVEKKHHYFPGTNRQMQFQLWKFDYNLYAAIRRAPVPADERRCLKRHFYRIMLWHRGRLFQDVVTAIKGYSLALARHISG